MLLKLCFCASDSCCLQLLQLNKLTWEELKKQKAAFKQTERCCGDWIGTTLNSSHSCAKEKCGTCLKTQLSFITFCKKRIAVDVIIFSYSVCFYNPQVDISVATLKKVRDPVWLKTRVKYCCCHKQLAVSK